LKGSGIIASNNLEGSVMNAGEILNRRGVLKRIVVGAMVAGMDRVAGVLDSQARAAEAPKLIDEQKDFSARALGFHHDGAKSPDRKDPKEHCGNCKQFKKAGVVDGVDVGKCSLLAKGLVKSTGWCKSYLKDPALYGKV
jgi:hypothetical protein